MIRRPPRSTQGVSSAASDVYKRQVSTQSTWDDVDLKNNIINVSKSLAKVYIFEDDGSKLRKQIIQTPKTVSSYREIPFPQNLNSVFKDIRIKQKRNKLKCGDSYIKSNYIFTTESGTNIDVTNLSHAWEKLLKKNNLKHKKFHALRHTYATKLFENEIPLKTVSELLGHSSIEMTADIHTHVIPKEKTNAVEKINYIFAKNQLFYQVGNKSGIQQKTQANYNCKCSCFLAW
eukprot:TRINITY_DN4906_c0_g1_i1.p1 TRINITY_DN4906_c0_g1~~TRINITY_DN4906_c0_g1_i1.p1  ORF type:complete len:232 (-),score=33.40 TRINITY_DN4906_c0_g1_i1:468-1163(-)